MKTKPLPYVVLELLIHNCAECPYQSRANVPGVMHGLAHPGLCTGPLGNPSGILCNQDGLPSKCHLAGPSAQVKQALRSVANRIRDWLEAVLENRRQNKRAEKRLADGWDDAEKRRGESACYYEREIAKLKESLNRERQLKESKNHEQSLNEPKPKQPTDNAN